MAGRRPVVKVSPNPLSKDAVAGRRRVAPQRMTIVQRGNVQGNPYLSTAVARRDAAGVVGGRNLPNSDLAGRAPDALDCGAGGLDGVFLLGVDEMEPPAMASPSNPGLSPQAEGSTPESLSSEYRWRERYLSR